MAAYFHGGGGGGTDIQAADGLQTLYLMNPGYTGFTDPTGVATQSNMVLLNSMNSMNPITFSHVSPTQPTNSQHFVGIPLHPASQQEPSRQAAAQPAVSAVQYNLWAQQTQLPPAQQGLSLTLSRELGAPVSAVPPPPSQMPARQGSSSSNGNQGFLIGSKYLRAAQQLLDEVVNVGRARGGELGKGPNCNNGKSFGKKENKEETEGGTGHDETGAKKGAELTTAERQELQMKKAKLVNMLDEVEQRYRQYHHQMQIVVSSFEAVAGPDSARTYTALALQTISKQFRCLRDAITAQIRSTNRSLGEEDTKTVGSRLRFIDHQLRQQRALQQLGMMQHNAWRPQRGLPERSVSILRAWLFEHFLHPYPKDSDKIMLAKQTGLTRSQVSNWFINARVRLWKPMVEEMYLEETKDQEQNTNTCENSSKNDGERDSAATNKPTSQQEIIHGATTKTEHQNSISLSTTQSNNPIVDQIRSSPMLIQPELVNHQNQTVSFYNNNSEDDLFQSKLKKARSTEFFQQNSIAPCSIGIETRAEEVNNRDLLMKFMEGSARVGFGPAGYTIGNMTRFDSADQFTPRYTGNGVSLTLGLPHCESLPLSGAQSSFLSNESLAMGRRIEMGNENNEYAAVTTHPTNAYEINLQNRKSFAAQLMRDFVA